MTRDSLWTAVLCRMYAVLLFAYPREFRRRFGAEMRQTFRDRWRAASAAPGLAPRMLFFVRMARDWTASSTEERMASMNLRRTVRGVAVAAASVVACFFGSSAFLQAYVIQSASMEGSLQIGDHVLVNKLGAGSEIERGELITFRYPGNPRETYVKRVIGLPGDRIRLADKQVIRNGQLLPEPYAQHVTSYTDAFRDNFPAAPPDFLSPGGRDMLAHHLANGEVVVPAGALFVLGDNRDDSVDSRYWGFVPRENVIGKPLLVYWSYDATPGETHGGEIPKHFFSRTRWNRTLLRPR